MRKVSVDEMLEKKYKTRHMVLVANHINGKECEELEQLLKMLYPNHKYEAYSLRKTYKGEATRYAIWWSLNYEELQNAINKRKEMM